MAKGSGSTRTVSPRRNTLSTEDIDRALQSVLDWDDRTNVQPRESKARAVLAINGELADYYGDNEITVGSIRASENGTYGTLLQVRSSNGTLYPIKENSRHYFEIQMPNGGRRELATLRGIKEYIDYLEKRGRKSTQQLNEYAQRFERNADNYVIPREVSDVTSILDRIRR